MKAQYISKVVVSLLLFTSIFSCTKELRSNLPSSSKSSTMVQNKNLILNNTTSAYWNYAQQTHNFIVGNLLTNYNNYKVNTTNNNDTYEWYNVSQIYADAAFVKNGDSRYAQYMNNTYNFMYHMWDIGNNFGGYFSATNINGNSPSGVKNVDDNALTGLAYLEAYDITTGTTQANYLKSTQACAGWLMNSGLWDNSLGGGFWWDTQRTTKPTQSNGLAMQLFLKLYKITGQSYYLAWANSVRSWLENNLYDNISGLYLWKIDANGIKATRKWTYDNAIMIEADLLYSSIMNDNNYTTKAQNLGIAMNRILWHNVDGRSGIYILSTETGNVNPCWCVWGSQAMVLLYQRDGNQAWLDYAQQNIDWLNLHCRNSSNSGYYQYVQIDGSAPTIDYEEVDQAWMQRTQVLLSNYR